MQQVTNTQPVITLSHVCFSYTGETVIHDVSLTIQKGDYVGIIGPNGGGKSTLLKLMLGLLKQQEGKITLSGTIGYVPQRNYVALNFPITVAEVVTMGRFKKLGLFRFPTKKDNQKVMEALDQVDMLPHQHKQLSELSGGQQQRAFIARALVSEPEIIILDEPTVGVDIKTQKQFYELLRKLNRELNLTLVLASHELDVVAHEATELGYINRSLVYYGDPNEFLKGKYFHELIGKKGIHHV
jgi:zinc transport system ATP-binding protein